MFHKIAGSSGKRQAQKLAAKHEPAERVIPLESSEDGFRDFVIQSEKERGLPGLINLIGIDSPGLTSSLAIAEHVEEIVRNL